MMQVSSKRIRLQDSIWCTIYITACALKDPPYALMKFCSEHNQALTISRFKQSSSFCINFWRPRTQMNRLHIAHDSSSVGAGPGIALFFKLEGGEPSDKHLSWRAAIKRVAWQPLSKLLCSLSIHVTWQSWNAILGPVCKSLPTSAKTDTEICHTYSHVQTDSG